ncbi:hypothetical protein [Rhizobium miluonense]|uniref:Uncharacterized protein n=1 Tax=Rhizobium miluonense TaxID=411945 RepID=A0A1C3XA04_9HYPH|nr:hypothetical protein [Rhizobium miluonense]SCB49103.1 hypothetical protein GA0061102_107115 [Rhizobium miluonense]
MEEKISDGLVDVFADGADIVIGLAEGIPGVGVAVKAAKLYGTIRDRIFMRQVEGFLRELDKTSKAERNAFLQDLDDGGKAERFGDTVTLMLAQLDNLEKSTIIGRLYSAAIRGDVELQVAERVSGMVSRVFISDLPILSQYREAAFIEDDTVVAGLAAIGLLRSSQPQQSAFAVGNSHGAYYQLSDFGAILIRYGLE